MRLTEEQMRADRSSRLAGLLDDAAEAEQPLDDYIEELEDMIDLIKCNLSAAYDDKRRGV
jgi:hypothetical protein